MKYLCWLFFIPALVFPLLLLLLPPHPPLLLLPSWSSLHASGVCVCVCVCVCISCLLVLMLYPHVQAPAEERARISFSAIPLAPLLVVVLLSASFSSVGCHTPSNTAQVLARMPSSFIFSPIFAGIMSHTGSSSLTRGQNRACTMLSCTGSADA